MTCLDTVVVCCPGVAKGDTVNFDLNCSWLGATLVIQGRHFFFLFNFRVGGGEMRRGMDVTYIMRNLLSETTGMNLLAKLVLFFYSFNYLLVILYDNFSWVTKWKTCIVILLFTGCTFGCFLHHTQ